MTAPDELVISVTAEDIRDGEPESACACPIALAIARLLDASTEDEDVIVGREVILIRPLGVLIDYELPASAAQFIRAFDNGDAVEPFTFTARLVGGTS